MVCEFSVEHAAPESWIDWDLPPGADPEQSFDARQSSCTRDAPNGRYCPIHAPVPEELDSGELGPGGELLRDELVAARPGDTIDATGARLARLNLNEFEAVDWRGVELRLGFASINGELVLPKKRFDAQRDRPTLVATGASVGVLDTTPGPRGNREVVSKEGGTFALLRFDGVIVGDEQRVENPDGAPRVGSLSRIDCEQLDCRHARIHGELRFAKFDGVCTLSEATVSGDLRIESSPDASLSLTGSRVAGRVELSNSCGDGINLQNADLGGVQLEDPRADLQLRSVTVHGKCYITTGTDGLALNLQDATLAETTIEGPLSTVNLGGVSATGALWLKNGDIESSIDCSGGEFDGVVSLSNLGIAAGGLDLSDATVAEGLVAEECTGWKAGINCTEAALGRVELSESDLPRLCLQEATVTGDVVIEASATVDVFAGATLRVDGTLRLGGSPATDSAPSECGSSRPVTVRRSMDLSEAGLTKVVATATRLAGSQHWQGATVEELRLDRTEIGGARGVAMARVSSSEDSPDPVSFTELTLTGEGTFRGVRFGAEVSFFGARFGGTADFTEARFHQQVEFDESQFQASATFENGEFEQVASFEEIRVDGTAEFAEARFRRGVEFDESRFQDSITFENGRFESAVSFEGVRFEGPADFSCQADSPDGQPAVFRADASFSEARFEAPADFRRSGPEGNILHPGEERSVDPTVRGVVEFDGARVTDGRMEGFSADRADFSGCDLQGTDLQRSDLSDADFDAAILEQANLTGAELTDASLEGALLSNARIDEQTTLDEVLPGDPTAPLADSRWPFPFPVRDRLRQILNGASPSTEGRTRADGGAEKVAQTPAEDPIRNPFVSDARVDRLTNAYRKLEDLADRNGQTERRREWYLRRKNLVRHRLMLHAVGGGETRSADRSVFQTVRSWGRYVSDVFQRGLINYGYGVLNVLAFGLVMPLVVTLIGLVLGSFSGSELLVSSASAPAPVASTSDSSGTALTEATLLGHFHFSYLSLTGLGYGAYTPTGVFQGLAVVTSAVGNLTFALLVFVLGRRVTN